ncbi:MAG: ATP-binding protein [Bacteroides sp.]
MRILQNKRHLVTLLSILLLIIAATLLVWSRCQQPAKRIWVLHSHGTGYEQYKEYNRLLAKELKKQGIHAELSFNYLNCNKYIEVAEDSIMRHWIDSVEAHHAWPDLILVTEDQATYALLSTHRPELRRCPILFGGVRFPNYKLLQKYDNVTGIRDTVDFVRSMEVLHELGGGRHAYTNLDMRFFDRQVEHLLKGQLKGQPILDNLHWEHEIKYLYRLPADSMSVTGLSMRSISSNATRRSLEQKGVSPDQTGNENFFWTLGPSGLMNYLLLKFDATSHSLAIMSLRPQFTGINNLFGTMGSGLLAGYFSSIPTWAAEQAAMAAELLHGTPPSALPIRVSSKDFYADWRVAQRYGIPLKQIPARYHLINITFRTLHPHLYWSLTITLYSLLVGGLIVAITAAVRATRKKLDAYKELKEKQNTLEIANTINQSFVWSASHGMAQFDDAFWKFIGRKPQPVARALFLSWLHPDHRENYLRQVARNRSTRHITLQMLCDFGGTGKYSWWELRVKGEHAADGNFRMFGVLFNIDETKQREEELIQARKRMEEADLKESFLANMSHEIRTPLNAIVGFSNILATPGMELEDEEKEEMMETINKNNELLLKLVNDILEISRIESGYMEFNFEHTDIQFFANHVYQSYAVQAPQHLQLIYNPGEAGLTLFIDKSRAQQIIMNFLTNAAKFTPKGSITFGWEFFPKQKEVELYVEDTGIGLSKDDCILVFNRFYKKDEFKQGTGLGLSICRVIAEKLHGRITVQSELNKGSRFSLWIKTI